MVTECLRGEIYFANLDPVVGHEQGARRPVVIIQNNVGNKYSPTVIVAVITTSISSKVYPAEVRMKAGTGGLSKDSSVLLNQIKTIDKSRLENQIGRFPLEVMERIDEAIKISLGLIAI